MKSLGTLVIVCLLAACGSSNPASPLDPFSPEITNTADNFELQATDVVDASGTLNYSWVNTGTVATIDHSTTTSAGSARLIVLDADGTVVYDADLSPSNNATTGSGTSGTWTIRLVLGAYDGTLNFRAQKST